MSYVELQPLVGTEVMCHITTHPRYPQFRLCKLIKTTPSHSFVELNGKPRRIANNRIKTPKQVLVFGKSI